MIDAEDVLYDHAPIPYLVIASTGGMIQRVNLAAVALLGRSREGLVGQPLTTFLDRLDVPSMQEHLHTCGVDDTARSLDVGLELRGLPHRVIFTSRGGQVAGDSSICLVTALDVTERRRAERLAKALTELSQAAWLPIDEAVVQIARLAVEDLADVCCVDLVERGTLRARAAIAHRDPRKVDLVRDAEERWGLLPNVSYARLQALVTRKPQVIPLITPEYLQIAAAGPDHLGSLVLLVLRSWVCVPLVHPADDAVVGVLRLATSGMRTFDLVTLALVEEFGRVASLTLVRSRQLSERLSESRERLLRMSSASVMLEEASRGLARLGSRDAPTARPLTQFAEDLRKIARGLKEA